MDAPICRSCGKKHWSRLCDDVTSHVTPNVTKGVTGYVTSVMPVTRPVTPDDPWIECERLQQQVVLLTTEIAMLKQRLAEKVPTTSAQRMRAMRERRKEQR
jgi:hypothetical protein